jgi:hypothetical protein
MNQTPCFEPYVIFAAEGKFCIFWEKILKNAMIDIDNFIFDKVSNVSDFIKLDFTDGTTVN